MKIPPPGRPLLAACALLLPLLLPAARVCAQANNGGQRATGANGGGNNNNNNQQRTNGGGTSAANSGTAASTRTYRNATQLGDALIQIDPETRSLIIVADEDTNKEISKVITNLDRPKPQVLIKVLFAQVTLDNDSDIGVEGNYNFNLGSAPISSLLTTAVAAATGTGTSSSSTTTTSPSSTITTTRPNPAGGTTTTVTSNVPYSTNTSGSAGPGTNFGLSNVSTGGFFRLDTKYATATLYALAQKGKVAVLSRPSILARNNQEAVILVGQSVPIPNGNVISDTGSNSTSVTYQDVGIILRVTPFITTNKNIEMIVSPEISSLSTQTVQISQNFSAPIINKTSAETVVVTPDQTTVVIGGLMQKTDSTQVNKVPLLGDIPLLGNAFKRTTKVSNKTELVIFMTPYIVEGTDRLENLSIDDVNRTDLPKEAFSPKDVSQYLDDNLTLFPQPMPATATTVTPKKTTRVRKASIVEK